MFMYAMCIYCIHVREILLLHVALSSSIICSDAEVREATQTRTTYVVSYN